MSNDAAWQPVHEDATIVDLHAHPSLKSLYFQRSLTNWAVLPGWLHRMINPLSVRTGFPQLQAGDVDVLLATAVPLERRILYDITLLKIIPLTILKWLPFSFAQEAWNNIHDTSGFELTKLLLHDMEEGIDDWNAESPIRRAELAKNRTDLQTILAKPPPAPIAIVHAVEGGHCLEGPKGLEYWKTPWSAIPAGDRAVIKQEMTDNLQLLRVRGVASIILAHFYPNRLAAPTFPFQEHLALNHVTDSAFERLWHDIELTDGLTDLGRDVVDAMVDYGILIDVTHATPQARREIYARVDAKAPGRPCVMASHVGAYSINPSPYNLEDWEIQWIANQGGTVGVIFMTYWLMPHETKFGLNFISRTIQHFIDAGGEDVVAIGTDFDGAEPPDDLDDASKLSRLTERLVAELGSGSARRYTDEQVKKFLGGNALAMLLNGWGT